LIGKVLQQRYLIEKPLGQGGMAAVYLAQDRVLDRKVAIKIPRPDMDKVFLKRFVHEAKIMGKLAHPLIVNIFDVHQEAGNTFLVMEYMDGVTVDRLIVNEQPLSIRDAVAIVEQVGQGLAFAHDQGIVHRDLKPSNILSNRFGLYKISDFGLARPMDAQSSWSLTATGQMIGTALYISPEQAQYGTFTSQSDIYSLGIVLFELVTGKRPFVANDLIAIVMQHIMQPLPDPRLLNPEIPDSIYYVIKKATEKNPHDRFTSVQEMIDVLHQAFYQQHQQQPMQTFTQNPVEVTDNKLAKEMREIQAAAERKDPISMRLLGWHLITGTGVKQNIIEGEKWLRAAAQANDSWAKYLLGRWLIPGEYLKQNISEGEKWLRAAVQDQVGEAMTQLGRYLIEGRYLRPNIAEGKSWILAATTQNNPYGMRLLGWYYITGNVFPQNIVEGEKLLRAAAKEKDSWAMYLLGLWLTTGDYLKQDIVEGEKWLRAAAEANEAEAMAQLGLYLIENRYLQQNIPEGEKWIRKAASLNNPSGMRILGWNLITGSYIKRDIVQGQQWLLAAAKANDSWAMYLLGKWLIHGTYLQQDLINGEKWLRAAAEANEHAAMTELGRLLMEGRYLRQNIAEAEKWFRAAANIKKV
jgi:serine/threonine protein kinase